MNCSEVLEFVRENDVKFVRLTFCDPFGLQKNVSIMADELSDAFENGVSFDGHAIRGFSGVRRSDLLLYPEAGTLTVLPWRPGSGRVARFYCDIKRPDGGEFSRDGRAVLRRVTEQCRKMGYVCKIGAECEFYLFKTDDNGDPTLTTLDRGGYLDISPLDRGEDIRREICLTLEEMGVQPESSHHEQGPGQNEIDFKFSDALTAADNLMTFKTVVKSVAARNGLFASFMPKPILAAPGSGLHVNLSLAQNGVNIFKNAAKGEHSHVAESFIAGVLSKTAEMTLFLNPITNSYERLGAYEAPKFVSWSHQNRSQLIRIPAAIGERVRMELRSPDPSCNAHIAFALILAAGLFGIDNSLKLPHSVDLDMYAAPEHEGLTRLPESLKAAICRARESEFVRRVIGDDLLSEYISAKECESLAFEASDDKAGFYRDQYFRSI